MLKNYSKLSQQFDDNNNAKRVQISSLKLVAKQMVTNIKWNEMCACQRDVSFSL